MAIKQSLGLANQQLGPDNRPIVEALDPNKITRLGSTTKTLPQVPQPRMRHTAADRKR